MAGNSGGRDGYDQNDYNLLSKPGSFEDENMIGVDWCCL